MNLHHHISSPTFSCGCIDPLGLKSSRRDFLQLAGASSLGMLMSPGMVFAEPAKAKYEAMVLSCIDPRFQNLINKRKNEAGLANKYSLFAIAGAAIGVVAPAFKDWHETFWQNLAASKQLHNINKVIVINHRHCGAAQIAYGDAAVATRETETQTHKAALFEFKKQLEIRQPTLTADLGLMDLTGKVEDFSFSPVTVAS